MKYNSYSDENHIKILRLINKDGATSRVEISEKLGLTKSAITSIINDMLEKNLIIENNFLKTKPTKVSRGRKKILLDINENYKLVLGIAIEKTTLTVGITNLKGETLAVKTENITGFDILQIAKKAYDVLSEFIKINWIEDSHILGIGVAFARDALLKENSKSEYCAKEYAKLIHKALERFFEYPIVTTHLTYAIATSQRTFKFLQENNLTDYVIIRDGECLESKIIMQNNILDKYGENLNWFEKIYGQSMKNITDEFEKAILCIKTIINSKKIIIFTDIKLDEVENLKIDDIIDLRSKNLKEKFDNQISIKKTQAKTSLHIFACSVAVEKFLLKYN